MWWDAALDVLWALQTPGRVWASSMDLQSGSAVLTSVQWSAQ
eukprot:gene13658-10078_t